jgi:hypothetical protein
LAMRYVSPLNEFAPSFCGIWASPLRICGEPFGPLLRAEGLWHPRELYA